MEKMLATVQAHPQFAAAPSGIQQAIASALSVVLVKFGNESAQKLTDAIARAAASGASWWTILAQLAPIVFSLFFPNMPVDIGLIIAAILALIKPAPTPVVT